MPTFGATPGASPPSSPSLPLPSLSIWVVGNPTSGGKRGAVVLGRLAKLFQKTYGAEAVQETHSTHFLSLAFPTQNISASSVLKNDGAQNTDVFAQLPSLEAIWASGVAPSTAVAGPTPPITPPSSPWNVAPQPSSSSVKVRTMLIHTEKGGHAAPVSNALGRLILRSRLTNEPSLVQQPRQNEASNGTSATAYNDVSSYGALRQHLVLVVGGDGTLSEVVNGLCEGTLAGYRHFLSAFHCSTSSGAQRGASRTHISHSSHAHVEQEAAVFTRLLPALLYVPGGTGADFAKLGLCCPTPEAALHVVRDGVVKMLLKGSRSSEENDTTTTSSTHEPACYACPVDIGRIEFLCTGTRHFFVNVASLGMSCDVIRRAERFKRSRFVSKLGGTLLFALSALISLLLMKPKPLYLCKLPPRTTRVAATPMDTETEASTRDINASDFSHSRSGHMGNRAEAENQKGEQQRHLAQQCRSTATTLPRNSLLSLPPFAPLLEQLKQLQTELRLCKADANVKQLRSQSETHLFSSPRGESVYAPSRHESAYECHADTPMPPHHAKIVQCSNHTPSRDVCQLLDVSEQELRVLRRRQAQYHEQAKAMVASSDATTEHWKEKEDPYQIASFHECSPLVANHDIHSACSGTNGKRLGNGTSAQLSTLTTPMKHQEERILKVNENDDLSALTWVELSSSMVAFGNGCWYGGGMYVAPHANPTDGMLSCTNWVATVLPFLSGAVSLYTGRHLRWRSTSAFEGERFLVCHPQPTSVDFAAEPLYMEADGEVLEPVPAIIELAGKIIFIVPRSSDFREAVPAPGTTRARLAAADSRQAKGQSRTPATHFFFAHTATQTPTPCERLRRAASGLSALWKRSWNYAQRWADRDGSSRNSAKISSEDVLGAASNDSVGAPYRSRDGNADEIV